MPEPRPAVAGDHGSSRTSLPGFTAEQKERTQLHRRGYPRGSWCEWASTTRATSLLGGLVACTGNQGCKYAATDTKGQAVVLGDYLNQRLRLDHPINIHLTGCPHSCAQHYIGDIGLQGVKVNTGGDAVEGYHVVFGGGHGAEAGIGQQVFTGIAFAELPQLLESVLKTYLEKRQPNETFAEFTRRHDVKQLQEMFSA